MCLACGNQRHVGKCGVCQGLRRSCARQGAQSFGKAACQSPVRTQHLRATSHEPSRRAGCIVLITQFWLQAGSPKVVPLQSGKASFQSPLSSVSTPLSHHTCVLLFALYLLMHSRGCHGSVVFLSDLCCASPPYVIDGVCSCACSLRAVPTTPPSRNM